MLDAVLRTKEVLQREELIYSKTADFSLYTDPELVAMNAFIRENARMLSIILAGGPNHFWNGQGLSTVAELRNIYCYIDDKVKEFLRLDKVIELLEIKTRYGRKGASPVKSALLSKHADITAFVPVDAVKGPCSEESLLRLADVCEKFAQQCRYVSQSRAMKMDDRARKVQVKDRLMVEVDSVLPMLRMHVLRIGLSKSQLKEASVRDANQKGGSFASRITALFTHRAVEQAHRDVEDSKERIMQEMLFRRAKVEKRLEREEEEEKERLKQLKKLPKGAAARQLASSGSQQNLSTMPAYQSAFLPEPEPAEVTRQNSKGSRSQSERGRSRSEGEESDSATPAASPKGKSKAKARPRSKSNDGDSSSPSRSPSPKGKKTPSKAGSDKKAGTKDKSKGDREESSSPRKSPKAKSKKAA